METKSCAIIGHRPTRFKFKYNENDSRCKRLKKRLREQFVELYHQGIHRFLVGGALGVDQWSGEILLKLKLEPEYKDIELVVVLPYQGHDERWDDRSRSRLAFLIKHSAECIIVGKRAWRDSFIQKDRYLVDHADCLLVVHNDDRKDPEPIISYALQKNVLVICVHPDSGIISKKE